MELLSPVSHGISLMQTQINHGVILCCHPTRCPSTRSSRDRSCRMCWSRWCLCGRLCGEDVRLRGLLPAPVISSGTRFCLHSWSIRRISSRWHFSPVQVVVILLHGYFRRLTRAIRNSSSAQFEDSIGIHMTSSIFWRVLKQTSVCLNVCNYQTKITGAD